MPKAMESVEVLESVHHASNEAVEIASFHKFHIPSTAMCHDHRKDKFKGNAGGRKFQCILTDPVKRRVLDILPSKNSEALIGYFLRFPIQQRNQVEYLVMDMSTQFRDVMTVCFPNAKVVVDKFHVCRHITWALENVRKGEKKKFSDERRKYFKRSRWLQLKKQNKLTEDQSVTIFVLLELYHNI